MFDLFELFFNNFLVLVELNFTLNEFIYCLLSFSWILISQGINLCQDFILFNSVSLCILWLWSIRWDILRLLILGLLRLLAIKSLIWLLLAVLRRNLIGISLLLCGEFTCCTTHHLSLKTLFYWRITWQNSHQVTHHLSYVWFMLHILWIGPRGKIWNLKRILMP